MVKRLFTCTFQNLQTHLSLLYTEIQSILFSNIIIIVILIIFQGLNSR